MIDRLTRRLITRRLLALIAGLVMIVLVLSTAAAKPTLAGWSATDGSKATFTAGTIGKVQNLQCVDSRSVLGTGLLAREVKLVWGAPSGIPSDDVEYVVTWSNALLSDRGSAVLTAREYTYRSNSLLTGLSVSFTVRARTKLTTDTWEGASESASATTIGIIYLQCN